MNRLRFKTIQGFDDDVQHAGIRGGSFRRQEGVHSRYRFTRRQLGGCGIQLAKYRRADLKRPVHKPFTAPLQKFCIIGGSKHDNPVHIRESRIEEEETFIVRRHLEYEG